jgi:hypothetical protein
MYGADPQAAHGRSVQEHVEDVLSYFKGKSPPMSPGKESVIEVATFNTTSDLLVWECEYYSNDCELYEHELELEIYQEFQEAHEYILADEPWFSMSDESEAELTALEDRI